MCGVPRPPSQLGWRPVAQLHGSLCGSSCHLLHPGLQSRPQRPSCSTLPDLLWREGLGPSPPVRPSAPFFSSPWVPFCSPRLFSAAVGAPVLPWPLGLSRTVSVGSPSVGACSKA